MRWPAFVRAQPELAAAAEALLTERHGYCYLATVDADGAPRVHPVAPILLPDGMFLAVQRRSAKRADLARDPRLALHCTVTPTEDEEVSVRGLARPVHRRWRERPGDP